MDRYFLIGSDDRIHELPVDKPALIGRAPICPVVLQDRLVSRVHAQINPSPKGPVFVDRGSSNGSLLNGRSVKEVLLNHGDLLQLGKFVFEVFRGTREEAERWLVRRQLDTDTDRTITGLNVKHIRETEMVGDLASFDLLTLVQTLVEQKRTGALTLTRFGEPAGRIYFTNGMIPYAEAAGGQTGKEAFFALAGMRQGQFGFRNDLRPPCLTILESPAALLLQACQALDEQGVPAAG